MKVKGMGISAVIVCRRSVETAEFWSPYNIENTPERPFLKICTQRELEAFNKNAQGELKRYMGSGNNSEPEPWYLACLRLARENNLAAFQVCRGLLEPSIQNYLRKSPLWKKKTSMEEEEEE